MKSKNAKQTHRSPKRVLRLPDLDYAKTAVLNTLSSSDFRRSYRFAVDDFVTWYCSEPRLALQSDNGSERRTIILQDLKNLLSYRIVRGISDRASGDWSWARFDGLPPGCIEPLGGLAIDSHNVGQERLDEEVIDAEDGGRRHIGVGSKFRCIRDVSLVDNEVVKVDCQIVGGVACAGPG